MTESVPQTQLDGENTLTESAAPAPERLSLRTILSYSAGQLGLNVTYTSIGFHLSFFYTDLVRLSPNFVALSLLIANMWDAITDPLMGHISDGVRWKRGRRRPFFGAGSLPMAIVFMLLFIPDYFTSQNRQFIYLTAMILLLFTFRTMVETPYRALAPELTLDYNERTRLSGYQQLFATLGDIIGTIGPLILLELMWHYEAYASFGAIAAFLAVMGLLFAYRGTTERGQFLERSSLSLVSAFKATLSNRPYLILVATLTLTIIANNIPQALMLYVTKYYFLDEALAKYFLVAFFVGAFLSIPFWIKFAAAVGKKAAYMVNIILYGFVVCTILVIRPDQHVLATVIMGIAGFFNLGLWILAGAITADVIEWDQLRTGERREGSFAGVGAFISKAAQGVGLALVNVGLDVIDYVPDAQQSASTLLKLRILYGPIPAAIFWCGAIVLFFYPITKKVHTQMLDEIAARMKSS
ncbi:MAG: MFS transporter [Candidatus Abyssubacteria bacterium]